MKKGPDSRARASADSSLLELVCNTKLSTIRRGQGRTASRRSDNPTYGITINTVKVENHKLRDSFTEAVIELIKPKARVVLECLPDT